MYFSLCVPFHSLNELLIFMLWQFLYFFKPPYLHNYSVCHPTIMHAQNPENMKSLWVWLLHQLQVHIASYPSSPLALLLCFYFSSGRGESLLYSSSWSLHRKLLILKIVGVTICLQLCWLTFYNLSHAIVWCGAWSCLVCCNYLPLFRP